MGSFLSRLLQNGSAYAESSAASLIREGLFGSVKYLHRQPLSPNRLGESQMTLVQAAERVLKRSGRPLHAAEIIERAIAAGLIEVKGKTPQRSLAGAIWKDMHWYRKGESPFMLIGNGSARKYWLKSKGKP